jgi:hypothetical protein
MKKKPFLMVIPSLALVFGMILMGCPQPTDDDKDAKNSGTTDPVVGGINWTSQANGTLTVINDTSNNMVLFQGQTPTVSNILGGVRALSTLVLDISDDVDDFEIGGYMILRGMKESEYTANKTDLSKAKIDYSAMATYGKNQKFRANISPQWTGDYYYKATNKGAVGIELRKDSPDGEKIGYLPNLATNYALYASSSDMYTVYPVYVFFNKSTNTVTSFKPTSLAATVSIGPRPVTDNSVQTILFPADDTSWQDLVNTISYPNAFIKVVNQVPNQAMRFQNVSQYIKAQNGYDAANSGESLTFEVKASDAGETLALVCGLYSGAVPVPVRKTGETSAPLIKNGYDYTVTLSYKGGGSQETANYTAVIVEGAKRDIKNLVSSL